MPLAAKHQPQTELCPTTVLAVAEGKELVSTFLETPGFAVLTLPDEASDNARDVATAVCVIATKRLHSGVTIERSLLGAAIGRDMVTNVLAEMEDRDSRDRKTTAAGLEELVRLGVLTRVGQLSDWIDVDADNGERVQKKGAYLYRLAVRMLALRPFATAMALRASRRYATYRGEGCSGRVYRCLRWALGTAEEGNRNSIGHWLTCRCTDEGLSHAETLKVMARYQAGVSAGYSWREATATVSSRYRRLRRNA